MESPYPTVFWVTLYFMQKNTYLRKTKNLVCLLFPVLPCVENQLYGFYSRVEVFPRKASRNSRGRERYVNVFARG